MATRRDIVAGAAAAALAGAAPIAQAQSRQQPNVVFFLADDLRFDGVGFRNPMVSTPNIDRLAREGTVFDNAFVTTSICCTSRASILSGVYARRHNVWDFNTHLRPELMRQSYPSVLKRTGYRTGYFGKYSVGDGDKGIPGLAPDVLT